MATNTTNYNLVKPAYEDTADIADINGNMDIIDGQMKTNADATSSLSTTMYARTNMLGTLEDGTDLDTLTEPGKTGYLSVSRTYPHHPNSGVVSLIHVDAFNYGISSFIVQTVYQINRIFVRKKFLGDGGTTWTLWQSLQMGSCGWQDSGTNIDNITDPGTYGISSEATYSGTLPTGVSAGILEVIAPASSANYAVQRLHAVSAIYERYKYQSSGTSWSAWNRYFNDANSTATITISGTDVAYLRRSGNTVQFIFRSGNFDAANNANIKLNGTSTEVTIPAEYRPSIAYRLNDEISGKRLEIQTSGKIVNVSGAALSNAALRFTTVWVI